MSNPWAESYDALRRPHLEEGDSYSSKKMASKDHDGDGKIESGSKEHAGVVHNAIQRAKGKKPDGKDTRREEVSHVDEKFSMAYDKSKPQSPRPTRKAENKKGVSAKSRTMKAVGTQRRQDKETGVSEEKSVWAGNYKGPLYAPHPDLAEGKKKGLWDNIHAKRKRGEKPAKPGDKDYPKTLNVEGKKLSDKEISKRTAYTSDETRQKKLDKIKVKFVNKEEAEVLEEGKKKMPYVKMYRKAGNLGRDGSPEAMERSKKITGVMNANAERRAAHRAKDDAAKDAKKMKKEETAIEEGSMKQARKNVGASSCWKGYKAKGTKTKNGRTVPNCVKEDGVEEAYGCSSKSKKKTVKKEHSDWRADMEDNGFFSEAAKRQQSLDIKTSGIKNKIDINPELKTEAKIEPPRERLKTDRDGYRIPQREADAAKARILAKTKKKREQAKENIMKGPLLPGEGRKVFPKGAAPKATGAKLPLANSYNPMLDSVEEQALQMIERTRYAKETGKDYKTGKDSKKGGTRDGKSAFDKVSREMRKTGGVMSSRGKPIQPQGKKKQPGKKGYKGVTPVDKIKGKLAQKKRMASHNPYKPRQGESD